MERRIASGIDLQAQQFELCPTAGQPGKVWEQGGVMVMTAFD